ncbi:MAG: T9SS type A sorting domain-containing protein [Bacteroidetes bacterium]|nr:T9SS type A sorting domain-containing protein [Bacteroidota bacterium]
MKNKYLLWAVCVLFICMSNVVNAQLTDDFESWPTNGCPDWWVGWDGSDCGGIVLGNGGHNGSDNSGFIAGDPTTIDPILDLGNKIFGVWRLSFYAYIPSGKEGYMNIQGTVPVGGGEWVVGNIHFNQDLVSPGEGIIDNSALGAVTFTFPHDEWFQIIMNWDISTGIALATWEMQVDGTEVIPAGTAFTDSGGTTATSLGGINFFSVSVDNELYLDDINFEDEVLGTFEIQNHSFSIIPNPAVNELRIDSIETIEAIRVYTVSGQLLFDIKNANTLDVSQLVAGTYFIEVLSEEGRSAQQFIKR